MVASVKTRIMELKDFERFSLNPGESKTISFTLTPYELSVLNDQMDRVVEPGEFKIMVGGCSPSYKAGDRIKDSVGYKNDSEGVNGSIDYTQAFGADFDLSYAGSEENLVHQNKRIAVKIRNKGNLNDIGKIKMYVNGVLSDEIHHYELDPEEEKTIYFDLNTNGNISFVTKYKILNMQL
jgi:beta-glucosidase